MPFPLPTSLSSQPGSLQILPLPTRELLLSPSAFWRLSPSSLPAPVTGSHPGSAALSPHPLPGPKAKCIFSSHPGLWPGMCRSPSREPPKPQQCSFSNPGSVLLPHHPHAVHPLLPTPALQVPLCKGRGETEAPPTQELLSLGFLSTAPGPGSALKQPSVQTG